MMQVVQMVQMVVVVVVVPTRRALVLASPKLPLSSSSSLLAGRTAVASARTRMALQLRGEEEERGPCRRGCRQHLQSSELDSPLPMMQLRHFREQGAGWT